MMTPPPVQFGNTSGQSRFPRLKKLGHSLKTAIEKGLTPHEPERQAKLYKQFAAIDQAVSKKEEAVDRFESAQPEK